MRGCTQQAVEVGWMHICLMSDEEGGTAGHCVGPRLKRSPRRHSIGHTSGGHDR